MTEGVSGFDWDDGNIEKCQKHGVSLEEIEALFLDKSLRGCFKSGWLYLCTY